MKRSGMKRSWRSVPYALVGAAVLAAALAAPAAWATPGQSAALQTIPTRTATPTAGQPTVPPPAVTAVPPTSPPATGVVPVPSALPPVQPAQTAAVPAQPTSGAVPAGCPAVGSLTLVADRRAIWQGATITFTVTLTNTARQTWRDIVLEDQLAPGLEPLAVTLGAGAWEGRTMRLTGASLAPGKQLAAGYTARVAAAQGGKAIVGRATASAAGCPRTSATVLLALAPSQLPATGGSLR